MGISFSNLAPRAQSVHRLADEQGFTLVGIAPAVPTPRADYLRQWLAAGRHGTMAYLEKELPALLDPVKVLAGARTVICVADRHSSVFHAPNPSAMEELPGTQTPPPPTGRIARYAWSDDYHDIIKKRLHRLADGLQTAWPEHRFRSCVDTLPVLEREYAQAAGLGWIGKNTLLIHPQLGSWLLLGEIFTTLPIQTSAEAGHVTTDHCGTCTRCLDACPTQCLTPYQIDARRCISYLTIEHRGPIDPALQPLMADWIAGCDVCQEVCPFNTPRHENDFLGQGEKQKAKSENSRYAPRPPAPAIPLLELLGWDLHKRQETLTRSALKRLKLDQLKRAALIATGNYLAKHDDPVLRQRFVDLAHDPAEPELVHLTAQQILTRLQNI